MRWCCNYCSRAGDGMHLLLIFQVFVVVVLNNGSFSRVRLQNMDGILILALTKDSSRFLLLRWLLAAGILDGPCSLGNPNDDGSVMTGIRYFQLRTAVVPGWNPLLFLPPCFRRSLLLIPTQQCFGRRPLCCLWLLLVSWLDVTITFSDDGLGINIFPCRN